MIIIKELTTQEEIDLACILLYNEYVEVLKWNFSKDNPSKIEIVTKNNHKMLQDRITQYATWFGAFDGEVLVGCIRILNSINNIPLEIATYPNATHIFNEFLQQYPKESLYEISRVCVDSSYKGKAIVLKLFLKTFNYVNSQKGIICGTTANQVLKSLLNKMECNCVKDNAFKFENSDPKPVDLYVIKSDNGEMLNVIHNIKLLLIDKNSHNIDIFKALEMVSNIFPVPIYWHDKKGNLLGVNYKCLEGMNKNKEDVIGKTPYDFYPKIVADYVWQHSKSVIENKKTLTQEEYSYNKKGNPIRSYLSIKTPLYDDFGEIVGVIGISIDITDQKNLERMSAKITEHHLFKTCLDNMQKLLQNTQYQLLEEEQQSKINLYDSEIKLTKRENEILYYLSINKSPKDIATILAKKDNKELSSATVLSIINKKLYIKFGVSSVSNLVTKAKMLNLISLLPS